MAIKACIFDVDNTLYSYDRAHVPAYRALTEYACGAFGLTAEAFDTLQREANRALQEHTGGVCAAIHNRLIRCQLILEKLEQPLSYAPRMAELYWSTLLDNMTPAEGLAECFDTIRAAGCRIGVGTNMTADYQFAKLERLGVLDAVDFLVSSEEAGAEKPERRFFDCCVQKAGFAAEECLFVGDDLQNDVLGARSAGLAALWLAPQTEDRAGVTRIAALADVPRTILLLQNRGA